MEFGLYRNNAKETTMAKCIDKYKATSYSLFLSPSWAQTQQLLWLTSRKELPAWDWPIFENRVRQRGLYFEGDSFSWGVISWARILMVFVFFFNIQIYYVAVIQDRLNFLLGFFYFSSEAKTRSCAVLGVPDIKSIPSWILVKRLIAILVWMQVYNLKKVT